MKKAELRQDYLTETWTSIAPARQSRPFHVVNAQPPRVQTEAECPFCTHNRHMTPDETFTYRQNRVIPNKYPALDGVCGFHEVLIDSPDHHYSLINAPLSMVTDTLACIQCRVRQFADVSGIKMVQTFKNHGHAAGASIYHTHWQMMALPFVPVIKEIMLANAAKYQAKTGNCYLCDVGRQLQGDLKSHVVYETDDVVAYCPYAAVHYYGVNIMPKRHFDYNGLPAHTLSQTAAVLQAALTGLEARFPGMSYNICFHQAPFKAAADLWHFYMQVIPRVVSYAGYEFSTSCGINTADPAEAAEQLRRLILHRA